MRHTSRLALLPVLLAAYAVSAVDACGGEAGEGARRDRLGDPLPEFATARCGTTRLRPSLAFQAISFALDGTQLALADSDGVSFADPRSGRELRRLEFDGYVDTEGMSFSPDGKLLAVAGTPGVRLISVATGRTVTSLRVGGYSGPKYDFSPDGKQLAIGTSEGHVHLHDLAGGGRVWTAPRIGKMMKQVAFSPRGRLVAAALYDDTWAMLDATSGKVLYKRKSDAFEADFSPDGKYFVTVDKGKDIVSLWDASTGESLRTFKGRCATFNPQTGALAYAESSRHTDSEWLAIRVMDVATGRSRREPATRVRSRIDSIVFSPDGKLMVYSADHYTLCAFDLEAGKRLAAPPGHAGCVYDVSFSRDGNRVITGSGDGTARTWAARTGRPLQTGKQRALGVCGVAFRPDGEAIAFGDDRKRYVLGGLTAESTEVTLEVRGPQGGLSGAVFSADRSRLAFAAYGQPTRVVDTATGKTISEMPAFREQPDTIALSSDGRVVASATRHGDTIHVWRVGEAKLAKRLKIERPRAPEAEDLFGKHLRPPASFRGTESLAFSPDGGYLASGHGNGLIVLWDMSEKTPPQRMFGQGTDSVQALALAPDGKVLASADWNGSVCLWGVPDGTLLARLPGHRYAVTCLDFSPDGTRLVSGGLDTTALLWDVQRALLAAEKERRDFDKAARTSELLASIFRSEINRRLSYGRKMPFFLQVGGEHDPPDDVFAKLKGLPATTYKASENAAKDRWKVIDPETGADGVILNVTVGEWLSPNDVIVLVSSYAGPLAGGGSTKLMSRRNGRWVEVGSWGGWIS